MEVVEAVPDHECTEESTHAVHEGNHVLGAIESELAVLTEDGHADENDDGVHKVTLALQRRKTEYKQFFFVTSQ